MFAAELRAVPVGSWVLIDEVQRLPSLLNEVHRAIEERKLLFALTGSSARKLRHGGTNLLGGRAKQVTMFPFVPEELGESFRVERAIRHGAIPLIWDSRAPEETLSAYVQTYLREEIQAEALVRNLPGFARFLPVAGLMHGQQLNIAALARDAGVARQTVTGYVEILADTLIANTLGAYESRLRVRERKHPKFYFFDPGVVRALKRYTGTVAAEERGALLEGFVYTLLRFYQERSNLYDDIHYWSPAEARSTEVDFLLTRGRESIAIEVKSGRSLRPLDLRGLRAVGELHGLARRILVFLGPVPLTTPEGIEVLPLGAFCQMLAEGTLWP